MPASEKTLRLRRYTMRLERQVQLYVFPIFCGSGTDREVLGSGFLLGFAKATVLVTAAHVLRHMETSELSTLGQTQIVPIVGHGYVTRRRSSGGMADHDIGFVDLDLAAMVERPSARPVSVRDCDVTDVPGVETAFGFAGVPAAANAPLNLNDVRSYFYGGLAAPKRAYRRLRLPPATHFVMTFDRTYMLSESGEDVAVPEPYGMSGGPVFRLGSFADIESGKSQPRVIAFGIEWHKKQRILLGVRIGVVLNAIAQLLPALASEIPRSPFFKSSAALVAPQP